MQTFLNCYLSKFQNGLPNVAIRIFIQANEIFDIFSIFLIIVLRITQKLIKLEIWNMQETLRTLFTFYLYKY